MQDISSQEASLIGTFLNGGSESSVGQAFADLEQPIRRFLDRYLRSACRIAEAELRADIVQEVLIKLWNARGSLQDQGTAAWWALLKRMAFRQYLDRKKREDHFAAWEAEEEHVPADELPLAEAVLGAVTAQCLYFLADCLFLGLDPAIPPEEQEQRLLAAQLFYLEGVPWDQVLRMIGPSCARTTLDRATLDSWLSDPGVLKHLAFRTLFWENEPLWEHLREAANEASLVWTEEERRILEWRYRYTLLEDQIALRQDCRANREEIAAICERCERFFPFSSCMQTLLAALPIGLRAPTRTDYARPALWQRLAFEYRYRQDIAHRDIQSRTRPAAQVVGGDVTEGMLNVWLSNNRLLKRLARFAESAWFGTAVGG